MNQNYDSKNTKIEGFQENWLKSADQLEKAELITNCRSLLRENKELKKELAVNTKICLNLQNTWKSTKKELKNIQQKLEFFETSVQKLALLLENKADVDQKIRIHKIDSEYFEYLANKIKEIQFKIKVFFDEENFNKEKCLKLEPDQLINKDFDWEKNESSTKIRWNSKKKTRKSNFLETKKISYKYIIEELKEISTSTNKNLKKFKFLKDYEFSNKLY